MLDIICEVELNEVVFTLSEDTAESVGVAVVRAASSTDY